MENVKNFLPNLPFSICHAVMRSWSITPMLGQIQKKAVPRHIQNELTIIYRINRDLRMYNITKHDDCSYCLEAEP